MNPLQGIISLSGRARNLPLLWKLLIPFLVLILFLGVFGAFLIVRDLSSRAEAALNDDLLRRSLDGRSLIHDRELYLLESANFASNLEGMSSSVQRNDVDETAKLLQSVVALKTDLTVAAVTDGTGTTLAEFGRESPGGGPRQEKSLWKDKEAVKRGLAGSKSSGFIETGERKFLVIAAPICSSSEGCSTVGAAIAGIDVGQLVVEISRAGTSGPSAPATVSIRDLTGRPLATIGPVPEVGQPIRPSEGLLRRIETVKGTEVATLFAPLDVQGRRIGILSVSVPTAPAFASVRGAGLRLALIFLAAMAGVMAIGAVLARTILRKVRPIIETNRAIGAGELSARVTVVSGDELGELALGVNQMAERLQASYETLERRVAERTEEVRRLLQERTDLFTAISHEFRTPVAVVLSQAEMMLDSKYPKKKRWELDAGLALRDSGEQLLTLINHILDLAKAEAGEIELHLEEFSLPEVIRGLGRTMKGLATAAGVDLAIKVARGVPLVMADRSRVREIILNLVDNAVKYTPAGGKVQITLGETNGKVAFSVSDTGIGIPSEAQGRIFEPFYTVPEALPQRGRASTGLGLALAKHFVEAQGGAITFTSQHGVGSTFTFTLNTAPNAPRSKQSSGRQPRIKRNVDRSEPQSPDGDHPRLARVRAY